MSTIKDLPRIKPMLFRAALSEPSVICFCLVTLASSVNIEFGAKVQTPPLPCGGTTDKPKPRTSPFHVLFSNARYGLSPISSP